MKTNKFFALVICIQFAALCSAFGQQIQNPSLYKISSYTGDSYILGTVHVGISLSDFSSDLQIEEIIKNSRVLLAERAFTQSQIDSYLQNPLEAMLAHSPYRSTIPLETETREKIVAAGVPSQLLDDVGDEHCGIFAAITYLEYSRLPLDLEIMKVALNMGLSILPLDHLELMNRAMTQQREVRGRCSLKGVLDQHSPQSIAEFMRTGTQEVIQNYRAGIRESVEDLNTPIVFVRNFEWLRTIEREHLLGRAFIAVGQSHLYGPNGLIELLRAKGFLVQKVQ